jgi:hypothetical protein
VGSYFPGDTMAGTLKGTNICRPCPMLLSQAEVKGGPHGDNLSVVAVRWEETYTDDASSSHFDPDHGA